MEDDEAVTLTSLTDDLLRRVLLASGATTIARTACTSRRFRALAADVRHTPACASSLVHVGPRTLGDAAGEAVRASLAKLRSASVSFLLLAASSRETRQQLPAVLDTVAKYLPAGVPVLGVLGSAVLGPTPGGAVEEHEDAVVALVVALPAGYTATVASPVNHGFIHGEGPQSTQAELLRWLSAPPACTPAWCAFFTGPGFNPETGGDNLFASPIQLSRAFPACPMVGGVARGIAVLSPQGAQLVPVATLTVWPPVGGNNPVKLRAGALATRGLVPFGEGAVHLVDDLEILSPPGQERAADELAPYFLSTRPLVATQRSGDAPVPDLLLAELLLARAQQDIVFLHLWREREGDEAGSRARAAYDVDFYFDPLRVPDRALVLAPPTFVLGPGQPRVLCQLMKQDGGAARECSRAGADSLAAYVTGGGDVPCCVVSAICNGRGADLFGGEMHVEADALGAAFGDAVLGIVVGGELGPTADLPLLDGPMPAVASLQAFTNCLAALGMP